MTKFQNPAAAPFPGARLPVATVGIQKARSMVSPASISGKVTSEAVRRRHSQFSNRVNVGKGDSGRQSSSQQVSPQVIPSCPSQEMQRKVSEGARNLGRSVAGIFARDKECEARSSRRLSRGGMRRSLSQLFGRSEKETGAADRTEPLETSMGGVTGRTDVLADPAPVEHADVRQSHRTYSQTWPDRPIPESPVFEGCSSDHIESPVFNHEQPGPLVGEGKVLRSKLAPAQSPVYYGSVDSDRAQMFERRAVQSPVFDVNVADGALGSAVPTRESGDGFQYARARRTPPSTQFSGDADAIPTISNHVPNTDVPPSPECVPETCHNESFAQFHLEQAPTIAETGTSFRSPSSVDSPQFAPSPGICAPADASFDRSTRASLEPSREREARLPLDTLTDGNVRRETDALLSAVRASLCGPLSADRSDSSRARRVPAFDGPTNAGPEIPTTLPGESFSASERSFEPSMGHDPKRWTCVGDELTATHTVAHHPRRHRWNCIGDDAPVIAQQCVDRGAASAPNVDVTYQDTLPSSSVNGLPVELMDSGHDSSHAAVRRRDSRPSDRQGHPATNRHSMRPRKAAFQAAALKIADKLNGQNPSNRQAWRGSGRYCLRSSGTLDENASVDVSREVDKEVLRNIERNSTARQRLLKTASHKKSTHSHPEVAQYDRRGAKRMSETDQTRSSVHMTRGARRQQNGEGHNNARSTTSRGVSNRRFPSRDGRKRRKKGYMSKETKLYFKRTLIATEGRCCQICSRPLEYSEMTLDHIVPKSRGGPNTMNNLRITCAPCNNGRHDDNHFTLIDLDGDKIVVDLETSSDDGDDPNGNIAAQPVPSTPIVQQCEGGVQFAGSSMAVETIDLTSP